MKEWEWGALGFLTDPQSLQPENSQIESQQATKFNPLVKLSAVERENIQYVNRLAVTRGTKNLYGLALPLRVWPGRANKAVHLKRMNNSYVNNAIKKIKSGDMPNLSPRSEVGKGWLRLFREELAKRGAREE